MGKKYIEGDLHIEGEVKLNNSEVATKQYVDDKISSISSGTKLYLHTITVNDTIIEVISSSSVQGLPQGTVLNAYVKCTGGAPSKQGYIYWSSGTAATSFATIEGNVDFYITTPIGAQWTQWDIKDI